MKYKLRILTVVALLICTPLAAYFIEMASGNSVTNKTGWTEFLADVDASIGFVVAIISSLIGEHFTARTLQRDSAARVSVLPYLVLALLYLASLSTHM